MRSTAAGPWPNIGKATHFVLSLYLPLQVCTYTYMPLCSFCSTHTCLSHSNLHHYFWGSIFSWFLLSALRETLLPKREDSLLWRLLLWYMSFLNCPILCVFLYDSWIDHVVLFLDCSFEDCFFDVFVILQKSANFSAFSLMLKEIGSLVDSWEESKSVYFGAFCFLLKLGCLIGSNSADFL